MEKLVKQVIGRKPANFLNWPNNWVLKLISLLFALLLWYFVVGEDKVDTTLFVPVEIVNLPRELVIANQYRKQLEVTISGPRGLISGINRQPISRTINLSKAAPGTMVIRNDPETMPFPRGINVLRLQPTHITLLIDRLMEKDIPIQAKTEGRPAEGHELAEVLFEPPFIRLTGPQGILEPTKTLTSKAIDISGFKGPVTAQVPLDLKPEIPEIIGTDRRNRGHRPCDCPGKDHGKTVDGHPCAHAQPGPAEAPHRYETENRDSARPASHQQGLGTDFRPCRRPGPGR